MSGTGSVLGTSKMTISEWNCGTVQPCNGTLSHMEHCHIWYCQSTLLKPHWWSRPSTQECTYVGVSLHVLVCEWVISLCRTSSPVNVFLKLLFSCVVWMYSYVVAMTYEHHVLQSNHTLEYTHSVIFQYTTHSSSQAEVKSTLVHEVPHHWEATTNNCIVKARPTIGVRLKLPVSKVGQQVLHTLKGATKGSTVKGSGWILWTGQLGTYVWWVNWVISTICSMVIAQP